MPPFLLATLERVARTLIAAFFGLLVARGLGWLTIDFGRIVAVSTLIAVATLLIAICALPFGGPGPGITEHPNE